MHHIQQATNLDSLLLLVHAEFLKVTESEWLAKTQPDKWSKKEILGHLIDSAQNNLRRLVVTQYQPNDKIVYRQDEWVKLQNYQAAKVEELMSLWMLLNKQLVRTIKAIPPGQEDNTCDTGLQEPQLRTLSFLIDDYVAHLTHHVRQILPGW